MVLEGQDQGKGKVKGASLRSAVLKRGTDQRPTYDQLYLAERISDTAAASSPQLSLRAIQKLNLVYGVERVTLALRSMRGFPPVIHSSVYAYVDKLCRNLP